MYEITITNSQSALDVDEALLTSIAEFTLREEGVAAAEISIAVVDNATIHDLNRRYLEHDYETDVLSFLLECTPPEGGASSRQTDRRGSGKRIEGEVVMSAEMASGRAAEFQWTPHEELVLYLVHGLLHLAGYDDLTDVEKTLMRSRERAILKHWQAAPGDSPVLGLPSQSGDADCHDPSRGTNL
jgi:probable rRNA maturation factor